MCTYHIFIVYPVDFILVGAPRGGHEVYLDAEPLGRQNPLRRQNPIRRHDPLRRECGEEEDPFVDRMTHACENSTFPVTLPEWKLAVVCVEAQLLNSNFTSAKYETRRDDLRTAGFTGWGGVTCPQDYLRAVISSLAIMLSSSIGFPGISV